jgi:hypothetical protein
MKIERQELRDYLLGRMPADLASELDTRLFAGDELYRDLQEERDSLIEDFVYGRLSSEDAGAFEAQCRQSPSLQTSVDSFRVFLSALDRQPESAAASWLPNLSRILTLISPALAVMLCVVTFLYIHEHRRGADLNAQLLAQSHVPAISPQTSETQRPSVVVFLSANVPRDSSAPPEIKIPQAATLLELQVELHPPSPAGTDWNVDLLRGDELIWKSAHLPSRRVGQETYLPLLIDPKPLLSGSYRIRFSPSSDSGLIQSRSFRITH